MKERLKQGGQQEMKVNQKAEKEKKRKEKKIERNKIAN